jgi:PAS domain S-box-containing protein
VPVVAHTDSVAGKTGSVTNNAPSGSAPTVPISKRTGSFQFWFADQRWTWSDEVAALHGYAPGEVTPTTELLLAHKHPDDRAEVADTLATAVQTGLPFSGRHRIIDTAGIVHHVLVVGDQMRDSTGAVVGTAGFYIDVTDTVDEERQEVIDGTLPEMVAAREVIEQAKGALMLVYGISADQAFRVLTWRSQETNTKLRVVAEQLVAALIEFGGAGVQTRTRFDHVLLTVHERPIRDHRRHDRAGHNHPARLKLTGAGRSKQHGKGFFMAREKDKDDQNSGEPKGGRPGPTDQDRHGGMATREIAPELTTDEAQEPPD